MESANPTDYVLCECNADNLTRFVASLTPLYTIDLLKPPGICLTIIRAEDSVERQEFYLGEALTTDCEVAIDGALGYGICLGDEPHRAYNIAVLEAIMHRNDEQMPQIRAFLKEQAALIRQREETEFGHILRTKVDFKLMEQA